MANVAVLGLGVMGFPMAGSFPTKGFDIGDDLELPAAAPKADLYYPRRPG
jgi:3-hydroxyisobutyrate dehydrogenase-like beta-hydroxyacid dehydrogenase